MAGGWRGHPAESWGKLPACPGDRVPSPWSSFDSSRLVGAARSAVRAFNARWKEPEAQSERSPDSEAAAARLLRLLLARSRVPGAGARYLLTSNTPSPCPCSKSIFKKNNNFQLLWTFLNDDTSFFVNLKCPVWSEAARGIMSRIIFTYLRACFKWDCMQMNKINLRGSEIFSEVGI